MNESDEGIIIEIADNGVGIKDDNIDKIFEAFYSTKPNKGKGIGLAMVKKILDLYKGTIKVESRENVGTTFTLNIKSVVK